MTKQTLALLLFWSMILTLATPLLTEATIEHAGSWLQLRFGYPFPFIEQTMNPAASVPSYYWGIVHSGQPPARLLLAPFVLSLCCMFLILTSLSGCWLELRRFKQKHQESSREKVE
ncbi:hypothetical protein [Ectobacillus ponti]|uniref:Uncharacterized protein n=1 Tax=Ectobacillus ponti TaxID=2961894 RepID=A0AA41XDG9_9BACI|nr:hypothetical protein [Ectobacillus ponti]MCP8970875.1 hypothetical protein [Ectobacillus ponti]